MLPEAMDLAEIDKLTGVPKQKGKYYFKYMFRPIVVLHSYVGTIYHN